MNTEMCIRKDYMEYTESQNLKNHFKMKGSRMVKDGDLPRSRGAKKKIKMDIKHVRSRATELSSLLSHSESKYSPFRIKTFTGPERPSREVQGETRCDLSD